MTLENLFSQMGLGAKRLTDRYSEYPGPVHEQQVYYAYEPSAPTQAHVTHVTTSKHSHGGGHKSGAMSALTLLAFLFFLHILQQCIKDHMTEMTSPPIMVMTAGREGDDTVSKTLGANKLDKTGVSRMDSSNKNLEAHPTYTYDAMNPYEDDSSNDNQLMKISASESEFTKKTDDQKFKYVYKSHPNHSARYPGFIGATDED